MLLLMKFSIDLADSMHHNNCDFIYLSISLYTKRRWASKVLEGRNAWWEDALAGGGQGLTLRRSPEHAPRDMRQ